MSEVQRHRKTRKISRSKSILHVSRKSGIPVATIVKWFKNEGTIRELAANPKTKNKTSVFNRSWVEFRNNLEEILAREIRQRRKRALKAKRRWICARAKQIRLMPGVCPEAIRSYLQLGHTWYYRGFLPRNDFALRRATNRKQKDLEKCGPTCFKFHQRVEKIYAAAGKVHDKYGHYAPKDVYNFDQASDYTN